MTMQATTAKARQKANTASARVRYLKEITRASRRLMLTTGATSCRIGPVARGPASQPILINFVQRVKATLIVSGGFNRDELKPRRDGPFGVGSEPRDVVELGRDRDCRRAAGDPSVRHLPGVARRPAPLVPARRVAAGRALCGAARGA